jgi:hypothetical protein
MPAKTFDWEAIKKVYVTGDMDYNALSREYNGLETSPSYQAIRNKASQDKWAEQRKAFRSMISTVSTKAPNVSTAEEIIRNTEALIDSAEAISRHIRVAKALQHDVLIIQNKLLPKLKELDLDDVTPFVAANLLKTMADVLTKATDIERKAMGLVDPAQNHNINVEVQMSVDELREKYRNMDASDLARLYHDSLN